MEYSPRILRSQHAEAVHDLEQQVFDEGCWDIKFIKRQMRGKVNFPVGVFCGDDLWGYAFYRTLKRDLLLSNIAVHPDHRRQGVGRMLLKAGKSYVKLNHKELARVTAFAPEAALPVQQLLKAEGFRCVKLIRDYYSEHSQCDAYKFIHPSRGPLTVAPTNRISLPCPDHLDRSC